MLRFAGDEIVRLLFGLMGAVLLAAALAALNDAALASNASPAWPFFQIVGQHLIAIGQGDFGISTLSGAPAWVTFAGPWPTTLSLLIMGLAVALLVGLPLGLAMSLESVHRIVAPLLQTVAALPVFCAALLLAFAAHHGLGWSPSAHPAALWPWPHATAWTEAVLPVMTVGLAGAAAILRVLHCAIAAEADASWPDGLKRLGLTVLEIHLRYKLPRLLAGVIAASGEILLALLSAAIVAEWVFRCPGTADLLVKAAALHDGNLAALILLAFLAMVLCTQTLGKLIGYAMVRELALPCADIRRDLEASGWHFGLRLLGWTVLGALAVAALLHDFLSPAPIGAEMVGPMFSPPSGGFPFGTDILGRDIYSETLHALAATLSWSLAATLIAITGGGLLGAACARLPSAFAALLRWTFGVFAAVPALVLGIVIVSLLSRTPALAVGLAATPLAFVRAFDRAEIRAQTRHAEFARATGLSGLALFKRDIRAELQSGLMSLTARTLASVVILLTTLGFLGFGPLPPWRDLGAMIASAKENSLTAWWTALFPILALALVVLSARLAVGPDRGDRP